MDLKLIYKDSLNFFFDPFIIEGRWGLYCSKSDIWLLSSAWDLLKLYFKSSALITITNWIIRSSSILKHDTFHVISSNGFHSSNQKFNRLFNFFVTIQVQDKSGTMPSTDPTSYLEDRVILDKVPDVQFSSNFHSRLK